MKKRRVYDRINPILCRLVPRLPSKEVHSWLQRHGSQTHQRCRPVGPLSLLQWRQVFSDTVNEPFARLTKSSIYCECILINKIMCMTSQKIQQHSNEDRTRQLSSSKKGFTPAFSALHEQLLRSCANSQIGAWKQKIVHMGSTHQFACKIVLSNLWFIFCHVRHGLGVVNDASGD